MTYKNVSLNLSVVAAIGLAIWTTFLFYRPDEIKGTINSSLPDAFMENVNAMVMDKDGHLKMKIIAPKLVHYKEQDATHLTSPKLTFYRHSPIPWFITARFAKAIEGAEIVDFWDNVVITHPADKENPETLIKTAALRVNTEEETAETKHLITMSQPNFVIKAIGMYADMDSGNIHLLSQARGEYAPT